MNSSEIEAIESPASRMMLIFKKVGTLRVGAAEAAACCCGAGVCDGGGMCAGAGEET
jgi:hypothetical protein